MSLRTEYLVVDATAPEPDVIERAANALARGALVAFPTETVYGLGGLADDPAAIAAIYLAKQRPARNPLIAHVATTRDAQQLTAAWPSEATALADAFWPGPLTLVLPRAARLPRELTAGSDYVAVRVPAHPVALALLRRVGRPIAAPSANPSTALSPTTAEHVRKGLDGRVALVLDGGPCAHGLESTVVSVGDDGAVRVLRPGALSLDALRAVAPDVRAQGGSAAASASPGQELLHYAPRARLRVAPRAELARLAQRGEPPVGVVTRGAPPAPLEGPLARALAPDPVGFGAALFATLHALDDAGCATVLVEQPPDGDPWLAVRDRLTRAAAR